MGAQQKGMAPAFRPGSADRRLDGVTPGLEAQHRLLLVSEAKRDLVCRIRGAFYLLINRAWSIFKDASNTFGFILF